MKIPVGPHHAVGPRKLAPWKTLLLLGLTALAGATWARDPGVTDTTLRIGSTLALEGDISAIGRGLKAGLDAALKDQRAQGRSIEFEAVNDFYAPAKTVEIAKQLIDKGVFLMLGSNGTPTGRAVLPLLTENKVPAVGFVWGVSADESSVILNFRANYAQEAATAVETALAAGVNPREVCAYAQNDGYGMSGLRGVATALAKQPNMTAVAETINRIIAIPGDNPARNNLGPVGVYQRDTLNVKEGYDSLKRWEKTANATCRIVLIVGTYAPVAQFIGYARYKKEKWVFGVNSAGGGRSLLEALKSFDVRDGVLTTQVVPALDSTLPVVVDARKALGGELSYFSLEGFIVGRMFLAIANNIKGDLTRENFFKSARGQVFDIGGLKVNFTASNQGSDFVSLYVLNGANFDTASPRQIEALFQAKP